MPHTTLTRISSNSVPWSTLRKSASQLLMSSVRFCLFSSSSGCGGSSLWWDAHCSTFRRMAAFTFGRGTISSSPSSTPVRGAARGQTEVTPRLYHGHRGQTGWTALEQGGTTGAQTVVWGYYEGESNPMVLVCQKPTLTRLEAMDWNWLRTVRYFKKNMK